MNYYKGAMKRKLELSIVLVLDVGAHRSEDRVDDDQVQLLHGEQEEEERDRGAGKRRGGTLSALSHRQGWFYPTRGEF